MDPIKKAAKLALRKARNQKHKAERKEAFKNMLIALGKALVKTEVPAVDADAVAIKDADGKPVMETHYDFPAYIKTTADGSVLPVKYDFRPKFQRLAWIGGKMFKQQGMSRKNRPGESKLHVEALVEDASRSFTREVDKALAPEVPVVPIDAAPEAAKL